MKIKARKKQLAKKQATKNKVKKKKQATKNKVKNKKQLNQFKKCLFKHNLFDLTAFYVPKLLTRYCAGTTGV